MVHLFDANFRVLTGLLASALPLMKRLLSLLVLWWVLCTPAYAQAPLTPTQRLTTLARVWGFLKYHHPGIARPHLDWDSVLVASIAPGRWSNLE
jgi:hypothetical protein